MFVSLEDIKHAYNIKKCKFVLHFFLSLVYILKKEKKKANLSKEGILMKFSSMGAKLINVRYYHISLIKKNTDNGKILKQYLLKTLFLKGTEKYIVSNKRNLVNKKIDFHPELPFAIFNSYVDIEKMFIIVLM